MIWQFPSPAARPPEQYQASITSSAGISISENLGAVTSTSDFVLDDSSWKNGFGYKFASDAEISGYNLINDLEFSVSSANNVMLAGNTNVEMISGNATYDRLAPLSSTYNNNFKLAFDIRLFNGEGEHLTIPIRFNITSSAPNKQDPIDNLTGNNSKFLYQNGIVSNAVMGNGELADFYRIANAGSLDANIDYAKVPTIYDNMPPLVLMAGELSIIPLPVGVLAIAGIQI